MEPISNRLWIYNRNKEIPFYDVRRIDYICESIPTGIGKLGIANEFDSFRVDLELGKDQLRRTALCCACGNPIAKAAS